MWGLAFACTVPKPKFCGSTTYEFGGQSLSGMSREFRWNSGLPDFRDAQRTQLVLDAIGESAKGGKWVDVKRA